MTRLVQTALLSLSLLTAPAAIAESVTIEADRDATLIEREDGSLANGSGPGLFAGRTGQSRDSIRRALLHFDVAAALPDGAVIDDVSLTLHLAPSNSILSVMQLRRVLADWGEGPSSSSGGGGAAALPGDATWIHTYYDSELWVRAGGLFTGRISASRSVGESGFYRWIGHALLQDVRLWAKNPRRNFGWILLGDETTAQSAKNFASRENPDPSLRPRLEIHYH